MKFEVTKRKTEDDIKRPIYYSEYEWYYTITDGNKTSWERERDILRGYSTNVASEKVDDWITAVLQYIDKYNKSLPSTEIEYRILDKRSNGQYCYEKGISGQFYMQGVQNYLQVPEDEIEAWDKAVKNYHKENNIPLPSDELRANINGANGEMNSDLLNGEQLKGSLPTIPGAIPKVTTDPCGFPSELVEGVKRGPAGILDGLTHSFNTLREKADVAMEISASEPTVLLKPLMAPVMNQIENQLGDASEMDTAQEAFRKQYASEIVDTEKLLEQEDFDEEDAITITESKYEIPTWMMENVNKAMKSRYGGTGVPNKDTVARYNSQKSFFVNTFKTYNVPEQMTLLCIIESNCKNITTENSATAKGMWQFIRTVGAQYGLLKIQLKPGITQSYASKDYNIVSSYDKRADVNAETVAAAKLLRDIRKARPLIKNWMLTAAAYNYGGGSVSKKIRTAGNGASVWDVWKLLPLETRNYVCLLIGLCKYFNLSTDILFE